MLKDLYTDSFKKSVQAWGEAQLEVKQMILTVEILTDKKIDTEQISEVTICCDEQGLDSLINKLLSLKGKNEHLHMMTPDWAGHELTDKKQGDSQYTLVNHLRIVNKN